MGIAQAPLLDDRVQRLRVFRCLLAAGIVFGVGLILVRTRDDFVAEQRLPMLYDAAGAITLLGLSYLVLLLDRTLWRQWQDTRRLQTRYRAIVDTQQEMIWRCAPDGIVTFVNAALCRAFEKTEADLIGRAVAALLPPVPPLPAPWTGRQGRLVDRPGNTGVGLPAGGGLPDLEVRSYLARLFQTPDRAGHRENLFSPPGGGSARWHQWCDRVLLDKGRPLEIQSTGYDITQRKAYEASLAQSEGRFAQVEQVACVGSYEIVLPAGPAHWSQGVYSIVLLAGKNTVLDSALPLAQLVQFVHPDDRARVTSTIRTAVAEAHPFDLVLRLALPEQPLKHLRIVGHAQPGPRGSVLTGLVMDVTDFREAESGLRHYTEQMLTLYEVSLELYEQTDTAALAQQLTARALAFSGAASTALYLQADDRLPGDGQLQLAASCHLEQAPPPSEAVLRSFREGRVVEGAVNGAGWQMAFPLLIGAADDTGGTLGVLLALYDQAATTPRNFQDMQITRLFCDQAAGILARARLLETSRRFADELQSLTRRLVEAQKSERRHIARELHDEVGQQLTGLRLMLEMAEHATDTAVRYRLAEMVQTAATVTNQVRELSVSLRPTMLDDLGLQPALCWLLERYTGQTGIKVDLRCSGLEGQRFATPVETVAYRIVQEALTNVARYAGVTTAQVSVWVESDALQVQVTDGGAGFDPAEAIGQGRTSGLSGMRERALSVGGELVIESAPGQGARVSARLPLGLNAHVRGSAERLR